MFAASCTTSFLHKICISIFRIAVASFAPSITLSIFINANFSCCFEGKVYNALFYQLFANYQRTDNSNLEISCKTEKLVLRDFQRRPYCSNIIDQTKTPSWSSERCTRIAGPHVQFLPGSYKVAFFRFCSWLRLLNVYKFSTISFYNTHQLYINQS